MNPTNIRKNYKILRQKVLLRLITGFVLAVSGGLVWLYAQDFLFEDAGYAFLGGFAVIFMAAYFWVSRIDKELICPACNESLMTIDGDVGYYIYLKECPHCQVTFK